MLQQVANFSEMASPRHLHIKRVVGGAGPLLGCGGRRQPSLFLQVGCLGLALGRQRQCAGPGGREHPPPHRPPLALVRTFPAEGAPLGYHLRARVGGGHIYPQVRLLNRVWRWMDVDTGDEITGLS
jgi:hypothetical protein